MPIRIIKLPDSPESRLAAVARNLIMREATCPTCGRKMYPFKPDYADLRDALRPYVAREMLAARLEEAEASHNNKRVFNLKVELATVELEISRIEIP